MSLSDPCQIVFLFHSQRMACKDVHMRASTTLVWHSFQCFLVAWYLRGGYYFDNDLEPISDFRSEIPKCTSLISVVSILDLFAGIVPPAREM